MSSFSRSLRFASFAAACLPLAVAATTSKVIAVPSDNHAAFTARLEVGSTDGRVVLSLFDRAGIKLLDSAVGIRTTNADLTHGLRLLSSSQRTVDEHYRMTTGKRLDRRAHMLESRYAFVGEHGAKLDLVIRMAPDGVAYRYELPDMPGATVTGEASSFAMPEDARAWLLPYNPQYEKLRIETTAGGAATGDFGYPSLFQVGKDYLLVTESNSDGRYSGSRLRHVAGSGNYTLTLADAQVGFHGSTPWRTVIAGSLATVVGSTLVDDLADPAEFSDTSWIRPGKVAWSWLSEHESPGDFGRQKAYVDFAARNHWPYVLVDEGWSDAWVPELVKYAKARSVDVLLWFHWSKLDTEAKRQAMLPKVKAWGVKGVKIDFMESDSQARYQWYDDTLADTAKLHLMVNFHGATIPHGLARTWPHIMSMEAVRGAENNAPPVANTIQTYTRNVVGSMDFTPVALDAGPKLASIAHEVALSVAFESGWLHLADGPEAYDRHPQALAFIDQVPTVWDDTKLLSGSPGQDAVIARRKGDRWFIGGIRAGEGETLAASLAGLGKGPWLVDLIEDPPGTERADVVHKTSSEAGSASLSVDVRKDGGFAAIICPANAGRSSCYE
jgi:alpha-glucosidase